MRSLVPLFAFALAAAAPALAGETISLPAFHNIELRGGGDVVLVPGPAQRVTLVEGSSAYTRLRVENDGRLLIDACTARCPQHYRLRVEIQSPSVPGVGVTGGGSIRAQGGFRPQEQIAAGVRGGGRIDLRAVEGKSIAAGVHGGGQIMVHPRDSLAAGVSGGGQILYLGNPSVTSAVQGGGSVRRGG